MIILSFLKSRKDSLERKGREEEVWGGGWDNLQQEPSEAVLQNKTNQLDPY